MQTLDSIGIKLYVLAALKKTLLVSFIVLLFMLCSASVNALQYVFSNNLNESTAKWETCQTFKEDRVWLCV